MKELDRVAREEYILRTKRRIYILPSVYSRSTISIATLNVCSLSGKWGNVLTVANSKNVDSLSLQETQLNRDNLHGVWGTAREAGWDPRLAAVCHRPHCQPCILINGYLQQGGPNP